MSTDFIAETIGSQSLFMKRNLFLALVIVLTNQLFADDIWVSKDSTEQANIELGEIIISASRDESKLKEIPTAITSISALQLERNQINSLEDAAAFAPNFMMLDYGTKIMSPVYIRGIGSKKNSPSVGMYVDGIPYFENSALSFDFYDLASLEILRGPQGTLYGRNTIGGLININTLSPEDYQGTNFRYSQGQYDSYKASIGHYGKTGKLAYSLSANYNYDGGYFTNTYDDSSADEAISYGVRNRLIYQLNNKLSLENIFNLENSTQSGYAYGTADSTQAMDPINYNHESGYDRLMINEGFKLNYDNNNWVATATLSYQHVDETQDIDQDFSPSSLYYTIQDQNLNMFSGEAIIRSKGENRYNWIVGAFAFGQTIDKTVMVNYEYKDSIITKGYDQNLISSGVFHQSKYKITDNFEVMAGVRFNYEKSMLDYTNVGEASNTVYHLADTSYADLNEFIVLPKVALTYQLRDANIYTSFSTGYKPGGFNSSFEEASQVQFKKEMSYNYELGVKGDFFNGFVFADAAVFLSNIEGQQIARSLATKTGTYLDNSGTSQNKGIELALRTRPIAGFTTSIAYGYTDAEITSYKKSETVDYSGHVAPFVPEYTFNATLGKYFYSDNNGFFDHIYAEISYQRIGDMYWNIENEEMQEAYGMFNTNITLSHQNFDIQFWGKNITNTEYNAYMFKTSKWYAQAGQPARFGTTLSVKF